MSYSQYILKHYYKYPLMRTQDFIKLIYQSEYGAHFGIPFEFSYSMLQQEAKSVLPNQGELVMEISSKLVRVNLAPFLYENLDLSILATMFIKSSLENSATEQSLFSKLDEFTELAAKKRINLPQYSVKATVAKYKQKYGALSHSLCYKKNYAPAYRIVRKDLWNLYEIIAQAEELSNKGTVIFCIEGGSSSGKSYYGALLKEYFDERCNLFSTDDFFLPIHRKSPERLAEIGGNIDYEALEDLLKQLGRGEYVKYCKFDCHTQSYQEIEEMPKQINIVEGVYSAHPKLIKHYNFVVLLTINPETQQKRILERNGQEILERYNKEWLPLENAYLKELNTTTKLTYTYDFETLEQKD